MLWRGIQLFSCISTLYLLINVGWGAKIIIFILFLIIFCYLENDADEDNGGKLKSLVQEEDWIRCGLRSFELTFHTVHTNLVWLPILMIYPETMVAGKLYFVLFQDKTIITLYLLINVCWGRIHIWQYNWQIYQWRDEHWKFKEALVLFKGGARRLFMCHVHVLYIWNVEYVALEIIWIVYLFWLIVANRVIWGWGPVKILN